MTIRKSHISCQFPEKRMSNSQSQPQATQAINVPVKISLVPVFDNSSVPVNTAGDLPNHIGHLDHHEDHQGHHQDHHHHTPSNPLNPTGETYQDSQGVHSTSHKHVSPVPPVVPHHHHDNSTLPPPAANEVHFQDNTEYANTQDAYNTHPTKSHKFSLNPRNWKA